MKVLIFGGTGFNGRHFISALRAGGHTVSTFSRHVPEPPIAGVEVLIGDRDGGIGALKNRDWDAVIDNYGFVPRQVRLTAQALEGHVGRYIYLHGLCVS